MTDTIEDYCDEIEENVDRIYNNAEDYSDEVLDLADEFRDAAFEIRNDAEAVNEKYFELKDRAEEQNEEISRCYRALERMATVEEQHQKTRRWIGGGVLAILTGGAIGTGILASRNGSEQDTGRETVRGGYDRDELQQLKACVDEDQMRGLGHSIDELLDPDEGRTVTQLEYVHDRGGNPSDVGSSFRYEVELEGSGDTHQLGWYSVKNEVLEPFAEARNHQEGLGEYAEENC